MEKSGRSNVSFFTFSLLAGGITPHRIFSSIEGLPSIEALGPRTCSGLAEEPSPVTTAVVDALIALLRDVLNLHVALFLASGRQHGLLPLCVISNFALLGGRDVSHLAPGAFLVDAYSFHE